MLPLRWKIFRAVNYLHLAGIVCLIGLPFFTLRGARISFNLFALLFYVSCVLLLINSCLNLFLLERCYPDKLPNKGWHATIITVLVLVIVVLSLLLILFVYGFFEEFFHERQGWNSTGKKILLLLAFILSTGIYLCRRQISLRRAIRRNYERGWDNFLG